MSEPRSDWTAFSGIHLRDDDRFEGINRHVAEMSSFMSKVEAAAYYLSVAFAEAKVQYTPPKRLRYRYAGSASTAWLHRKCADIQWNVAEVGKALTLPLDAELAQAALTRKAFMILAEDVPARQQLVKLLEADHQSAFRELAKHVVNKGAMITQTACLLAQDEEARAAEAEFASQYEAALDQALTEAGGALTLTEAATRMGMSKAAVHKKVTKNQALGLMRRGRLLLPVAQFVETSDGPSAILDGLADVLPLFAEAREGPVGALQWLLARHPRLKATPFEALREQRRDAVCRAARAYLQLDGH